MVQAILSGVKHQMRWVIKSQPQTIVADDKSRFPLVFWVGDKWIKPLHQLGDRLYVWETWTDLRGMGFGNDPLTDKPFNFAYKADIKPGSDSDRARIDYGVKWKPSIHVPKAAARIWLEVTDVRVERV